MHAKDIREKNSFHFIGVGGIGMSALALLLLEMGKKVSGSDLQSPIYLNHLKDKGAAIYRSHDPKYVEEADVVVFSTSISSSHCEYLAAQKKGICLIHRSELLNAIIYPQKPLLVAGAHGKTSTSALLAFLLEDAGYDPSFALGGIMKNFQTNAKLGKGKYFVAEVDESDGSFLKTNAYGAIITNVDEEHMDFWKTMDHLHKGVEKFALAVEDKNKLMVCDEDPFLMALEFPKRAYGFSSQSPYQIIDHSQSYSGSKFSLKMAGQIYGPFEIFLYGRHQLLNTSAAVALCLELGVEEKKLQKGLASFLGVKRRCDRLGTARSITLYDDYAHHPTEIEATLQGLRSSLENRRVITVFQPHRYSRVKDHFEAFGKAFYPSDFCLILDIYSAGEAPIEGVSSDLILEHIDKTKARKATSETLFDLLDSLLKPQDAVIFMGAGDISSYCYNYYKRLQQS